MITRRSMLWTSAGAALASAIPAAAARPGFRIGSMDGVLKMVGNPEAFALAAKLGLEGVEVNLRRNGKEEALILSDPAMQEKYKAASKAARIPVAGVVLSVLHQNHFKSDKLALKWVHDGIKIAHNLKAGVLLLPFFGPAAIQNAQERDHVADLLKDFGPEAKKAGVTLGIEDTISAEDNARLLDRAGSKSMGVYYDVGNSTNIGGFDAPKEIRWLGRARICQMHLKDKGYLGEGKVNMPEVIKAMVEIGYRGWANLETSSPSGKMEDDVRRNLAYLRGLMKG